MSDLVRGLTQPRVSRRRMLQLGGLAALGLPLTACGISGTAGGGGGMYGQSRAIAEFWAKQKKQGTLDVASWPLYIDNADNNPNDHPTLDQFDKQYGIKTRLDEIIQDDDSYYGKIQPVLAAGQGTGYDIMIITNGIYLDKLIAQDYLIPLDQSAMTNFYAQASPLVLDPSFDRGNVFTMAWQSGITGIAYDRSKVGKDITSWNDLLDPKLSGKIGMFGDTEDLPNSALCAVGVNPETSTPADWAKAKAWLLKQRPLVRKYYSQDYVGAFTRGDLWATMAWSGDIFQHLGDNPNFRFVVPDEGAPIWTDNLCIPVHAKHPRDAMMYMDFNYRPEIAAMLAAFINYITPVPGAQPVLLQDARAMSPGQDRTDATTLATSPLIFPTAADQKRLHRYRVLDQSELTAWEALFEPVYQS